MSTYTKIPPRPSIEQLGVYVAGKPIEEVQRELGLEQIYKMASNENPLGYSPKAKEAIREAMEQIPLYPESMAPELAERLSLKLQSSKDNILISNGSDEIIRLLTRAYIRPGDEVLMADVTFPRYETNVLIEGGVPVKIPLTEGVHDLKAMLEAITERTKMICLCNPHNPTGTVADKERLRQFIEQVPDHILLISDEAYYEYAEEGSLLQTIPLLESFSNLVVLRTFSKVYGLAALRVGYGIMHPSIVAELVKVKDPFNTNRLGQAAALASLEDEEFVRECVRQNTEGRRYLERELNRMGLGYYPSQTNFLMIKLGRPGKEVTEALLKRGIIIRSGHLLGYDDTIRVSIGKSHENEAFITALQESDS